MAGLVTTSPRDRPILFSAPMVRALLDGSKTQTRRVIGERDRCGYPHSEIASATVDSFTTTGRLEFTLPQRYTAGDRLWVRETWAPADGLAVGAPGIDPPQYVAYRADHSARGFRFEDLSPFACNVYGWNFDKLTWKPSIFMPRWASRLTLEVTEARVERVQDISEGDARAEGVQIARFLDARQEYAWLWDSINGERAGCLWSANPWVWVVSFRRVAP